MLSINFSLHSDILKLKYGSLSPPSPCLKGHPLGASFNLSLVETRKTCPSHATPRSPL